MGPTIPLPGRFIVADDERPFLTVTDGLDPLFIDTGCHQVVLGRLGPPLPKSEVVLLASALVAVSLDDQIGLSIGPQPFDVLSERLLCVWTDQRLIIVEEDVLEGWLSFCFSCGHRGRRSGSRSWCHGRGRWRCRSWWSRSSRGRRYLSRGWGCLGQHRRCLHRGQRRHRLFERPLLRVDPLVYCWLRRCNRNHLFCRRGLCRGQCRHGLL